MKKLKIVFKNGQTQVVSQETANIIRDRITAGTTNWQCFSSSENDVFMIVNLIEIAFICDLDYKI